MAVLRESARHGLMMISAFLWDSKARMKVVYEFQQWYKLDGGAVVEESCYAIK